MNINRLVLSLNRSLMVYFSVITYRKKMLNKNKMVMKRILIVAIATIWGAVFTHAQDFTVNATGIVSELSRVYHSNTPVNKKHLQAKEWAAKSFGDYKTILQFEDNENYKIVIRGYSNCDKKDKLRYIITIDSREDKYRVLFEEVHIEFEDGATILIPEYIDVESEIKRYNDLLVVCEAALKDASDKLASVRVMDKPRGTAGTLWKTLHPKMIREHQDDSLKLEKTHYDLLRQRDYHLLRQSRVENTLSAILQSIHKAIDKNDDF